MWQFSALNPFNLYRNYRLNALLAEFSRRAGECESPEDVYRHMESVLAHVIDYDRVVVRLVDQEAATLSDAYVSGQGIGGPERAKVRPLPNTVTGLIAETGEPFMVPDCAAPEIAARYPHILDSATNLPSLLGVPLVHRGAVHGALIFRSRKRGGFSRKTLRQVGLIAAEITPTLVNSTQLVQLQREVHERTVMADMGRMVSSTLDFSLVWNDFVEALKTLLPCDRLVIALIEEDNQTIIDRYVYGVALPNWDDEPERKLRETPSPEILGMKTGRIIPVEEVDRFSQDRIGYKLSEHIGLRSSMYAPLISRDRVIGTLSVRAMENDAYAASDLALFERIATQIGGSLAASEFYSRSIRLAEEKAARVELEARNRQLASSNRTRARFISAISHELRTPLTSMLAFTDILRRNKQENLSEKELGYLEVVKRNGIRLKDLVDDLLDIASIESDNMRLTRTRVSIQEAVESAIESVQTVLEPQSQKVSVSYLNNNASVNTDIARLDQILTNMLRHASKSSHNNTEITVEVKSDGGRMIVTVEDRGEGLSQDELAIAFEEFGRLDDESNKANEGRGLGLPLSRQLARVLGGDIEMTSVQGKGSKLVLTLPPEMDEAIQPPLAS